MRRLIRFELRKIFARRLSQAALILVLLLSVLLNVSGYLNKYAFDGKKEEGSGREAVEIDKRIAARYEGLLTDEKVRQVLSDFAPKNDLHGMNAAYLYQNAAQSAVFVRFADPNGNWNGRSVSEVFGEEEIRVGYTDGWLSTCENMIKVALVLSLAVIAMTAPVFCGEYEGFDNIILTSRYGRTGCAVAKAAAGILTAFLVTGAVTVCHLTLALFLYGTEGLDASILFASADYAESFIPFNITCGTMLGYQVLLAFTGTVGAAGIALLLSAACRRQAAALAASGALYLCPVLLPVSESSPLFGLVGLLPVYQAQFISLMSVEELDSGLLYAVWAVPAAVLLGGIGAVLSCRIFSRHQVV